MGEEDRSFSACGPIVGLPLAEPCPQSKQRLYALDAYSCLEMPVQI